MTPTEWLNSPETVERSKKPYAHFDWRTDVSEQREYIADPKKVARHGFYPFIHYEKRTLKYSKKKGRRRKYVIFAMRLISTVAFISTTVFF